MSYSVNCKPIFGEVIPPTKGSFAFILMSFDERLTTLYQYAVKPVVESKGLKSTRADDYKTNKVIMKEIWEAICKSQVVIADMTGLNPNVMYELGISHTLGKETILMIQENSSENLKFPFDLAHIRRIQYKDTISEFPRLQRDLSQTLDSVLLEVAQASMVVHENKGAIPSARREEKRGHLYLRKNVGKREEVQGLEITISNVEFGIIKLRYF